MVGVLTGVKSYVTVAVWPYRRLFGGTGCLRPPSPSFLVISGRSCFSNKIMKLSRVPCYPKTPLPAGVSSRMVMSCC